MKLAISTTHPIQYQVPWFRALAQKMDVVVGFSWIPDAGAQGVDFGVPFDWDQPLLDGYPWEQLGLEAGSEPALDRPNALRLADAGSWLRKHEPDAVLVTGWHSRSLVQMTRAARRLRLPVVVRGESNDLARRSLVRRLGHRIWLRSFAAFLVIGEANRRFYEAAGVDRRRMFDTPYFVDNDYFLRRAAGFDRGAARARFGIPDRKVCFLFAGKLVQKKRPSDLVRALQPLARTGAQIHLLVVGDGMLRGEIERLARERDVPTSFAGFLNQSEISAAYVAADALVLPSDAGETWGLVMNEAMLAGRSTIVSDLVGGREDLVLEGVTGWSYPCGDVALLTDRLRTAAADPDRLVAMGERARARVLDHCTIERAVEGTLAACEFVLRERRQ